MPVTDQELQAALEDVATMAYYFVRVAEPLLYRYRAMLPEKLTAAFSNLRESSDHLFRLRNLRNHERTAERNPHA